VCARACFFLVWFFLFFFLFSSQFRRANMRALRLFQCVYMHWKRRKSTWTTTRATTNLYRRPQTATRCPRQRPPMARHKRQRNRNRQRRSTHCGSARQDAALAAVQRATLARQPRRAGLGPFRWPRSSSARGTNSTVRPRSVRATSVPRPTSRVVRAEKRTTKKTTTAASTRSGAKA
jgi:hypothetical protein